MKEPYSHHILYAKGHYLQTNVLEDLKVIQSRYSGVPAQHITVGNIQEALLSIIMKYDRPDNQTKMEELMDWFRFDDLAGFSWNNTGTYTRADIDRKQIECWLSIIMLLKVGDTDEDGDWQTIIDLEEPDYTILPRQEDK